MVVRTEVVLIKTLETVRGEWGGGWLEDSSVGVITSIGMG